MAKHMVIAPGEPVDRSWFEGSYSVQWMPRLTMATWELDSDPFMDMPQPLRATLRTYHHPAWKVRLRFYVDERLGLVNPVIPPGYVLPGSVHGERLESRPWGTWVHWTPTHRWQLVSGGAPIFEVSCEVLAEGHIAMVQEQLARAEIRPLPREAWNGCPPRPEPEWTPHTLDELADLLGYDDDQAP